MERVPRTATAAITALTALAWIIAAVLGQSQKAAYQLASLARTPQQPRSTDTR